MKKPVIAFWVSTSLIFITQSVLELVAYFSGAAEVGVVGLGYPAYFVEMLVVAKVLGGLALILPQVPAKIKEWAYAGFTFDFIAAFISMWAVGGFSGVLALPIIAMAVLMVSYRAYHNLNKK